MWVANAGIQLDLQQLAQRLSHRNSHSQSLETLVSGDIAIPTETTTALMGGGGGLFDDVFSAINFIALFPVERYFHVYASNLTQANNPIIILEDGAYLAINCTATHLMVANPHDDIAISVRYIIGGEE